MTSESKGHVSLAKSAWEEAAPIHWRVTSALLNKVPDPTLSFLHDVQRDELVRLGVDGADVVQLNCNNGTELISIKRLGAGRCTGFDIASGFIDQARELSEAAGETCEFVCCDAYEVPREFYGSYDIVVVTAGALCFMPDLAEYFAVARRLLRPTGSLSIYECHPITRMFAMDRELSGPSEELVHSYFDNEPIRRDVGLDYRGGTTYKAKPIYYYRHKLSDILMAMIATGFRIDMFIEHDRDPSNSIKRFEEATAKPPLSFVLSASVENRGNHKDDKDGQAVGVGDGQ